MPPGGIRTRNLSRRSAADPRLRQLGHWDRISGRDGLFKPETYVIQAEYIRRHNIPKSIGLAFLPSEFQMI
jgi:hypothetical protein